MGSAENVEDNHAEMVRCIKCQVKAIMEEAVTKKFVHEESSHVIRLCGTINSCMISKLKKRYSGFLKTNKVANLFNNIGKTVPAVAELVVKIEEALEADAQSQRRLENTDFTKPLRQPHHLKFFWVRMALTEKLLDKILDNLVQNSRKYYEKSAILADPVNGPLIASIMVGPCALDYTKMKTTDHYWSDPPADELMQRQRLHSRNSSPNSPGKRPTLHMRYFNSDSMNGEKILHDENMLAASSFRDYVESLHQNSKTTLLYGKNNVVVQPKEDIGPIPGYLSLHQDVGSIFIKWTPNQLMNNNNNPSNGHLHKQSVHYVDENRSYWKFIMSINIRDVVYLHCHQQQDKSGTVVFVGQDGVQHPPICFPPGGHLLAFLTCLEAALLPRGHLDPPLRSQRGKGKVFPRIRNGGSTSSSGSQISTGSQFSQSEIEEPTDFVFRVTLGNDSPVPHAVDTYNPLSTHHEFTFEHTNGSADIETARNRHANSTVYSNTSLKTLCDTMKRQIISRAFYGWLGYSRQLSAVRTHLSALVNDEITQPCQPINATVGVTKETWEQHLYNGKITNIKELMRHVYFGGIDHDMRKTVWPFLLKHYPMDSTVDERNNLDLQTKINYEEIMTEWLAVEVIVKQREREAVNLAKLSTGGTASTSSTSSFDHHRKQSTGTINEVFVSLDKDPPLSTVNSINEEEKAIHSSSPDYSEYYIIKNEKSQPVNIGHRRKRTLLDITKTKSHTPYSSVSTDLTVSEDIVSSSLPSVTENSSSTDRRYLNKSNAAVNFKKSMNKHLRKQAIVESLDEASHEEEDTGFDSAADDVSMSSSSTEESVSSVQGFTYSSELLDDFGLNLHRIEKDVHRCDRNHIYFTVEGNLDKLRNVMCSYVWKNLSVGYMQGMCDIAAPLLIIFDDESKVYSCFTHLMKRMGVNFPNGGAMDTHLANVRSLLQVLDPELYEHMHQNGDYTHFYFCYRWFLLDFKRELSYKDDVFAVWERIWSAEYCSSNHFGIFFALAMLNNYRNIILDNDMDFTDIIKFFNEMAERHDAKKIIKLAQNFVSDVQLMIHK